MILDPLLAAVKGLSIYCKRAEMKFEYGLSSPENTMCVSFNFSEDLKAAKSGGSLDTSSILYGVPLIINLSPDSLHLSRYSGRDFARR